ncbi:MAG: ABC transporter substrate-binding protein, partial [Lachnospiraceae bacterium]|nr:ABC transporter substrate-binding protein [Lachnospiraceae bacterium]
MTKKVTAVLLTCCVAFLSVTGCGKGESENQGNQEAASVSSESNPDEKKTMTIGDTTFNPENAEPSVNPLEDYAGWACIRYGVGETLVHYSDSMELEPWLAKEWENLDELTWKLTLQDGVKFHSGRTMDAEAVKQCLEALIQNHDRAPGDLMID